MNTLRNLPTKTPEQLASLIEIREGRVVSMALSRSEACQMMLMAFGTGESVSEESYAGDTFYLVLDGKMPVTIGSTRTVLETGDSFMVPSGTLHAIGGSGNFKILQITVEK